MTEKTNSPVPRILFAAPGSGSGKTMITCGFLEILRRRGISPLSFKCGPDYIDPMFHQYVLGIPGCNLDSFFLSRNQVRNLFAEKTAFHPLGENGRMAVIEGVMGYYDGVGGVSTWSSTYEIAGITNTPVVLIVDGKASSLSLAALVKGFLEYRADSRIQGVILNRTTPMMAKRLAPCFQELGIRCFGTVPVLKEAMFESRHLGLTLPAEQKRLREKICRIADVLEETLDVDELCSLAQSVGALPEIQPSEKPAPGSGAVKKMMPESGAAKKTAAFSTKSGTWNRTPEKAGKRRIGVARDEAFCFYYQENLDVLEAAGWIPCFFSPLHDEGLPDRISALLLGGGYPECYAKELSENTAMKQAVREAALADVRILAECGGFLYLHRTLEGMDGRRYPMAGLIDAEAYRTEKLSRFGYVTLRENCGEAADGGWIRGHEFHYWDSTDSGQGMRAEKPMSDRAWTCMHKRDGLLAGFPHLYYPSNPEFITGFLDGNVGGRTEE